MRLISCVVFTLLVNFSLAYAEVQIGNIKFKDDGKIVFSDNSEQSTATIQGPAGPQGATGGNGYNSLILTSDEISGPYCANGGTKIQVGLDQDRNGVLDFAELVQTKYVCNGSTSGIPTSATVTVTASPSTPTVNTFTNIVASVKNADGSIPTGGNGGFESTGSCKFYTEDPYPSYVNYFPVSFQFYNNSGVVSVPLTKESVGPCSVTFSYYNPSTQVTLGGSGLATFVPDSGTTPVPTSATVTVTASPSTLAVNTFTNIVASVKNADGSIPTGGNGGFESTGSCKFYTEDPYPSYVNYFPVSFQFYNNSGVVSVPLTKESVGPCSVTFSYYNPSTQVTLGGSGLATFILP